MFEIDILLLGTGNMAGAFTHFMICQEALKDASPDVQRLVRGVSSNLYIGAVSPDIPYLAIPQEKTGSFSCADYMHYYKTNGIPEAAVSSIRDSYINDSKIDKSKFAWTLGYISHVIIDAVIHPIVEAIVGPYQQNKTEHMLCEMVQDAFVFKAITGREIDGSFVEENLTNIDPDILVFWRYLFFENYFSGIFRVLERNRRRPSTRPQQTILDIRGRRFRVDYLRNSIRPAQWTKWYRTLLRSATGSTFRNFSRHTGVGGSFTYKSTGDILTNSPDHYEKYYRLVKLPGRSRRGAFMKFGFNKAVKNVRKAWQIAYRGVTQEKDITSFIKNWDLDTGIVNGSSEMTFWV